MSESQTFRATGLTCGHCGGAVTEEVRALEGVHEVVVDVVSGGESTITVLTDRLLTPDDLEVALAEAGDYHLVAES